jgi:hypothetical protein
MITDAKHLYEVDADLGQVQGTYQTDAAGDVYDTRGGKTTPANASSKWGAGKELFGYIQITADVSGTSSTIQFEFISSAAATLTTPTTHWDSGAIAEATLVDGYEISFRLPPNETYLRYLGFQWTVGTATTTAGTCTFLLTPHIDVLQAYASGLTFHPTA